MLLHSQTHFSVHFVCVYCVHVPYMDLQLSK